jgi:hypothetical protein
LNLGSLAPITGCDRDDVEGIDFAIRSLYADVIAIDVTAKLRHPRHEASFFLLVLLTSPLSMLQVSCCYNAQVGHEAAYMLTSPWTAEIQERRPD